MRNPYSVYVVVHYDPHVDDEVHAHWSAAGAIKHAALIMHGHHRQHPNHDWKVMDYEDMPQTMINQGWVWYAKVSTVDDGYTIVIRKVEVLP